MLVRLNEHGMGADPRIRGQSTAHPGREGNPASRLVVREGSIRDYDALGRFHYKWGRPATVVRVLVAVDGEGDAGVDRDGDGEVVGVLVVSMPTLNGAWRDAAWPGPPPRYRTGNRRADAHRLNREVRTISRVVVDPRWRGVGVARTLVRSYLDNPLTEVTEAAAAMGAWCPFFRSAGMREVLAPPPARDLRLIEVLRGEGIEPWELAGMGAGSGHAQAGAPPSQTRRRPHTERPVEPHVERALRVWANNSRGTRGLLKGPVSALMRAAAAVAERRVGYVWEERV